MNITALGRTGYKEFSGSAQKAALSERFKNYFVENSAVIVGGMMALNGNPQAYKTYLMLKNDTVQ